MDISRYLARFIKEQREAIVPGLGTFHRLQQPARYDAATQTFLPPTERISFRNQFSEDTKLIELISSAEGIDVPSATYFLEQYVSNLNDLLSTTEQIKIDALGTFSKNSDGYQFEANEELMPDLAYGLTPQREIGAPIVQEAELPTNEVEEPEEETQNGNTGKKLILIFLITLLAAFAWVQFKYPQWLDYLKTTWQQQTIDTLVEMKPEATVQPDLPATDSTLNSDSTGQKPEINHPAQYEIVVAAFGKRDEAENYTKQLIQRGFQAHILEPKSGEYFKIRAGSFNDEKTAQTELKRIQTELSASAWLYHVKPVKLN